MVKLQEKKNLKTFPFPKLLPNIFTTIGLCSGLTGVRFALDGNWQYAVFCILSSCLLRYD
jgi:CDP-diacylglycerol--serine O-phosphatidyltransferase